MSKIRIFKLRNPKIPKLETQSSTPKCESEVWNPSYELQNNTSNSNSNNMKVQSSKSDAKNVKSDSIQIQESQS